MSVVTLHDVVPNPRFDGVPWTNAHIEEAVASTGPWVQIATFALDPVDDDPTSPRPRDFTTDQAQIAYGGWYRAVFYDDDGEEMQESDPKQNIDDARDPYLPSVDNVANLMRARTKDKNGNELGFFSGDTRPDYIQVDDMIRSAADEVLQKFPSVPTATYGAFQRAIVLRTAMDIELSYYPEQVATDRSPYSRYAERYDSALTDLQTAWDRATALAEDSGDDPGGMGNPQFYFPRHRTIGPNTVM